MSYKSYKYRLLPNASERILLHKTFGCSRKLYNLLVNWYNLEYERWKKDGKKKGDFKQAPLVTFFKKEYDYMKEVDSLALMNARQNMICGITNFLASIAKKRKGKKVNPPKFKKKGVCKDSYTTNCVNENISLIGDRIKLPKFKKGIKLVLHRELQGTIKSATISMEKDGTYYISILCEVDESARRPKCEIKKVIGLDMSPSKFFVSSDENVNNNLHYVRLFRKSEKKLARLNRRLSKKAKESKNRDKARRIYAKAHRHLANKRKDFVCKTASYLTKNFDCIVIEDLNMQAMSRMLRLGKSVNDMGWGMFTNWLAWDCEKNGCTLLVANKFYASSKLYNHCGEKYNDLALKDREWQCPHCGHIHSRDLNAAYNLRDYFFNINNTVGTTEIQACGEVTSTIECNVRLQVTSMKQEATKSLA